jgi:hypothetical protein
MEYIIQCNFDLKEINSIIEEEKYNFVRKIFELCSLPVDEFMPENFEDFDVEKHQELRAKLETYNISILNYRFKEFEIYLENDLIAKFFHPQYSLRRDLLAKEKSKKIFAEVAIKNWSVFEEGT